MLYSIRYLLAGSFFFWLVNFHMTGVLHTSQIRLLSWCVLEYFIVFLLFGGEKPTPLRVTLSTQAVCPGRESSGA